MKKIFIFGLVLVVAISFMSCARIPAGYTGLRVNMMGSDAGAVTEVSPGWKSNLSPNIEYYTFPQFVQNYNWTEGNDGGSSKNDEAIRFQTSEGLQITADLGISFEVNKEPGTAARMYLKYRRSVEELIDTTIRNFIRDSFMAHGAEYTADQIIGDKKDELIKSVLADAQEYFAPDVRIISLSWLSSPRPPQNVIEALNLKVQATQLAIQKENEVRTAKAEADKAIESARGRAESLLIEAKAQSEANRLLSNSLSANLIQNKWIEKWNGNLPTVTNGSGGGVILDYRQLTGK